MIISKRWQWRW